MKLLSLLLLLFSLNSQSWNCNPEKPEDYAKCLEEVEKTLSTEVTIEGALTKQCGENLDKKIEGAGCAFKLFNY